MLKLEDESERKFKNILDVQNLIYTEIRSLDTKMAEIVGRQERMFSLMSVNPNTPAPVPGVAGGTTQMPNVGALFNRLSSLN